MQMEVQIMLKGISPLLSPDLLRALMAMGHGDYIALCDANCPVEMFGREGGARVLRADGISAPDLLKAILDIMPVDESYPHPFLLGNKTANDAHIETPIWDTFRQIACQYDPRGLDAFEQMGRDEFCAFISHAYAVVQTGERALYGNIAIRKGVIKPD